jgi:hypothetical protein
MNPTRHEPLTEFKSTELRIEVPAGGGDIIQRASAPDLTEDLANEITAELNPTPRWITARPSRAIEPLQLSVGQASATAGPGVATGSVLRDRYVLEQQLGNGGTALVFRAVDLRRDATATDGHHVAIKLLRPEMRDQPACIARLQREFRQTQALSHPNVVRFYDLDCDRGVWFIVMELLTGESLGPRVRRASPGSLPRVEALCIAAALGDALAYAHDNGVIHGDVKPDNVFVTASGAVRLLDFGVAPESTLRSPPMDPALAVPVGAAATRVYASPEVLAGQDPEPRDDVFSLCCVIYEMLAGRHPYGRRCSDAARESQLSIEPPAGLSTRQWSALSAGLAWSRDERPELRQLIESLCGDADALPASTVPHDAPAAPEVFAVSAPVIASQRPRRFFARWRGGVIVALALTAGLVLGRFAIESPPAVISQPGPGETAPAVASSLPTVPAHAGTERPEGREGPGAVARGAAPPVAAPAILPPASPGLVTLESASMTVSGRAVVAAIPVRHLSRDRPAVQVGWRLVDGSAQAGRDYGGPLAGVAKFAEGHAFRIIYVPIITGGRVAHDRTFFVELTNVSTGAGLGSMHRILVTIEGET